uniref:monoglyceride lipase isoform X2 n=2 Tax=Doryrhamphus excisus TaxID=161450 RepID=UPI0025AEC434|nr:monoglyceride lipase isoform X2 [Doryrhamphus excisus]
MSCTVRGGGTCRTPAKSPPFPPCPSRELLLGGVRREFHTATSSISSTPMDCTCSAATGSPPARQESILILPLGALVSMALVFIAHGAGEHCGPYDEIAETLKEEMSLLVFAHDHVGHGQSEGDRMNIKDFQVYIRDSLQHIDLMRSRHPDLPVFIVGHSMGGAISILVACERPTDFAGVVLIAPMVQMNPDSATPFKVFLAKILNHMLPSLTLGSIESKWVSRDKKQVEAYDTDELNFHGGLRISFGMQLMGAAARIERAITSVSWPFLLLHGDADKLCDIRGSKMMFEKAPSSDKKLKVYEGGYHALHHDLPDVVESVLKEVTSWIRERLPDTTLPSPQGL